MHHISTPSRNCTDAATAGFVLSQREVRRIDSLDLKIVRLVCAQQNVPLRMIFHRSRCRKSIADARQLAMYLLHVCAGRSLIEIGQMFSRDRTTVSHACGKIEDRRDNPAFDSRVAGFESDIAALIENMKSGALATCDRHE